MESGTGAAGHFMAKNKKEKEVQKSAAIPPIDAKRTAVAGGGGGVGVGGIISQRITNSPPHQNAITANINGKRELQKLPLLMETAPGEEVEAVAFTLLEFNLIKLAFLYEPPYESTPIFPTFHAPQVRSGRIYSYKKFDKPASSSTSFPTLSQI